MPRALLLITLAVVAFARVAAAEPCADDAGALRGDLEGESRRVDHWVLAWRIVYTSLAAGEFALAASTQNRDDRRGYWVGAGKSALGALGFWFAPLRVHVPPPSGDACTDRSMLRNTSERVAGDEAASFWTGHIGGLIVNAGSAVLLGEIASWRAAALSFATGYPVGLISTYTMPRASWRRVREPTWTATVMPGEHDWKLVVAGSF